MACDFFFNIYLFGCVGSWLQHWGPFIAVCRLRSRGAQAVALQHVGSQFSDQGSILWPLSCKADSSPLGKSLACDFLTREEAKVSGFDFPLCRRPAV